MSPRTLCFSAVLLLFSCTGCDLFRALADRPLESDLERMRIELSRKEDAEREARLDSVARYAQEIAADTASAVDSAIPGALTPALAPQAASEPEPEQSARSAKQAISAAENAAAPATAESPVAQTAPAAPAPENAAAPAVRAPGRRRYYVSLGCYGSRVNAERLRDRAAEAGYDCFCAYCASGKTIVKAGATEDRAEAEEVLSRLRKEKFCPRDACVVDRARR